MLKICKHTFYPYLSRIWKLARFTRFIRKVFATKILLSGKFSFFLSLMSDSKQLISIFMQKDFLGPLVYCLIKHQTSDFSHQGLWKSAVILTLWGKIALATSVKTFMTTASTKKRVANKTTNTMSATSHLCYVLLPIQKYCCISIANTSCIKRKFCFRNSKFPKSLAKHSALW